MVHFAHTALHFATMVRSIRFPVQTTRAPRRPAIALANKVILVVKVRQPGLFASRARPLIGNRALIRRAARAAARLALFHIAILSMPSATLALLVRLRIKKSLGPQHVTWVVAHRREQTRISRADEEDEDAEYHEDRNGGVRLRLRVCVAMLMRRKQVCNCEGASAHEPNVTHSYKINYRRAALSPCRNHRFLFRSAPLAPRALPSG